MQLEFALLPHIRRMPYFTCTAVSLCGLFVLVSAAFGSQPPGELVAHWRFEQVLKLDGSKATAEVGQPLTASDRGPVDPRPYALDESGKENHLQASGPRSGQCVFSDDVPRSQVNGHPNTRSLLLNRGEYVVPLHRLLPYYDMRKGWRIEASLRCNTLGTEQVFICKEGSRGQRTADLSIGFDNMERKFFVEVTSFAGTVHRLSAGDPVEVGKWYDLRATAQYDVKGGCTTLTLEVKPSHQPSFTKSNSITYPGPALKRGVGTWVLGRGFPGGFPNSLTVLNGQIDEVRIWAQGLPYIPGQNPIFTNTYTADPAPLVVGDTLYVYVGHDKAGPGGWFYMPEWLCYSTKDMTNWTFHGPVIAAKDFTNADPGAAWAAHVVEKDGKFYFYATLNSRRGHFISVAVADTPTGPFKEARPGKPLITDDMTTDSHRPNADIDPCVIIDDDGTPWMFWGNGDCYMVRLARNMVELDGPIMKVPFRNYSEGPWVFKRGGLYYMVYAADVPGTQPEQVCYATAPTIHGPWTYRGLLTGPARHGFTIHPAVIEFKGRWYFFYHDGCYSLNGGPGGDCRRAVCVEYLHFNPDGSIQPITLTDEGIAANPND